MLQPQALCKRYSQRFYVHVKAPWSVSPKYHLFRQPFSEHSAQHEASIPSTCFTSLPGTYHYLMFIVFAFAVC